MAKQTSHTDPRDPLNLAACTCANLRRAMRAVTQAYDAALAPTGLRATQFTVLAALSLSGDVPLGRLAKALGMDRTTLTRNLRPLSDRGLVEDVREGDQRVRLVRLTASGRALLEDARPLWERVQERTVGGLGQTRWAGLLDDLDRLVGGGIRA
jgi:DNA-binding MarR family transcriptional regulator